MSRSLREQAEILDEPTLLESVVPAARLEAAALDHAAAEGAEVSIAPYGSSDRNGSHAGRKDSEAGGRQREETGGGSS